MNTKNDNIYNVESYSDVELFQLMDLVHPSDRELEAKIVSFINKYKSETTKMGLKMYHFFYNVYNRFFDNSDSESEEEEEENFNIIENFSSRNPRSIRENLETAGAVTESKSQSSNIGFSRNFDYAKDTLNPLLNQTIRRVISIDSSYRPNQKDLATSFTFNLSDPLKDVLSLKLYSVQIPYTWYTISKQYGSNFFFLKAISPGIDNGDHDYQTEIPAGNYSPANLVSTINESIQTLGTVYTDVSFATTGLYYNSSTGLATFTIDIQKLYNETNYYLYFPTWATPTSIYERSRYVPSFFGYNYNTYTPSSIYSLKTLPLTSSTSASSSGSDYTQSIFDVSSNNYYFTIKHYYGTSEYSTSSSIIGSFDVSFSTNISVGNSYSRNSLYTDLNSQLQNHSKLQNSYIERVDVTDSTLQNYGYSYYKFNIVLNRNTNNNVVDSKTVVIFPPEDDIEDKLWTGSSSCFRFESSMNELSNVISETNVAQTNYIIQNSPYIYLKCINAQYGYDSSGIDFSGNDYKIVVPNSTASGYLFTEYLSAINTAINSANLSTIASDHPYGDFNIGSAASTNIAEVDSTVRFTLDVNHLFNQDKYSISFGTKFQGLGFSNSTIDLSGNSTFTGTRETGASYTIDSADDGYYIMTIAPNTVDGSYGNQYAFPFYVPAIPVNGEYTYGTLKELSTSINLALTSYTDTDGDAVLSKSSFSHTINSDSGGGTTTVTFTLNIVVRKYLTQTDYELYLYDPTETTGVWESTDNTWYNYLKFYDQSYNLTDALVSGQSYSYIYGNDFVFDNQIDIVTDENDTFYIKALSTVNGLYTSTLANDVTITIPSGTYTRGALITQINSLFSSNSLTSGSSVSIKTLNGIDYTNFRLNVNKVYTANDYSLLFFDRSSFLKCYTGTAAIPTTWDSTVGWVLGFRSYTQYDLLSSYMVSSPDIPTNIYYQDTGSYYYSDPDTNIVTITGDTAVSVNLYNYFLITLDDFCQSRLNDGLITITPVDSDIPLPSYANLYNISCNPNSTSTTKLFTGTTDNNNNNLTEKQIYAANEINSAHQNAPKVYSDGPYVKDIFGIIPMKTAGLANGSVYVEFGGSLQNQDRVYFGPVNIHRFSIQLTNDRGNIVDLNGANWSFSFMCEQLYQQQKI
jgi:hypothetical protein